MRPDPRDWKAYTDYVSEIVIGGFATGIIKSIDYMAAQLDPVRMAEDDLPPLLEVQMVLEGTAIRWKPDLGKGDDDSIGVKTMFKQWLKKCARVGLRAWAADEGVGATLGSCSETISAPPPRPRSSSHV